MQISKERRERWKEVTRDCAFNQWLGPLVTATDGTLDLDQLHALAASYGIDKRKQYAQLNPGQQRMNLGNMLRKVVPPAIYETPSPSGKTPAETVLVAEPEPLARASVHELLRLHGEVMAELKRREIVRTSNNPIGDYAELLFSTAFAWQLENSSASGHDATDENGLKYQIKSRRITPHNASRQLSFLRRLPERKFDFLAAVLFDHRYHVKRAIILPHEVLGALCRFSPHANGWLFRLEDACWNLPGARDVTDEIIAAAKSI
jgi:hypothetical protein